MFKTTQVHTTESTRKCKKPGALRPLMFTLIPLKFRNFVLCFAKIESNWYTKVQLN